MLKDVKYEYKIKDIYSASHDRRAPLACEPHLHKELELVIYESGRSTSFVDSVRYELEGGDVFLTFPDQIHHYETHEPEQFHIFIIKTDLVPELEDVFSRLIPSSPVVKGALEDPIVSALWRRLAEVERFSADAPMKKQLIRGYLLSLLSEIISRMELVGIASSDSDAMHAIISFCSANYSSELSLSVLEEHLHLNRYYISHLFSGKLGIRFNDYVNSLRLTEACKYLGYSSRSITEISTLVGFNTLRTFNRAFIKKHGMSPSEYRKRRLAEDKKHTSRAEQTDFSASGKESL